MIDLNEIVRDFYTQWGIIDHRGGVQTGHDAPAEVHADLTHEHVPPHGKHKVVEYAIHRGGVTLMVRTRSKGGLTNVMKNWDKLPSHLNVMHDHRDPNHPHVGHYGDKTPPHKALVHMNKLLNAYDAK